MNSLHGSSITTESRKDKMTEDRILKFNSKLNPKIIANFLEGKLVDPRLDQQDVACDYKIILDLMRENKKFGTLDLYFHLSERKIIFRMFSPDKYRKDNNCFDDFCENYANNINKIILRKYSSGNKFMILNKKRNLEGEGQQVILAKSEGSFLGYYLHFHEGEII